MSAQASRLQEQNEMAQLAADFNEFYLETTLPTISQIGNYRILQEVGEGAFGKVYLAEHVLLKSQVVLKCGLLEDPNIVREIYYHKQLRHRNIVKLYEVIKTETQLWMVLEYCKGNELYYHIYEKRRLDVPSCKHLFYQIVEAIRYVHSLNLSHRDLKLENILMADEEKSIIKLTDFGFVREFNPYKRTLLSTMCGTTSYMAPEVLKNEKYSGFAIDVWSMGVILYAMVYGQLPFDEDDEMRTKLKIISEEPKYQESMSPDVNQLLQQMLSKDPSQRPSISEILNSSFLIDLTNLKTQRRNSNMTDTESIVSINQYYNVYSMPFQSKMEKDLLKKFRKANVDIESLVTSKLTGCVNALTAFYDLALMSEFEKHKKRRLQRKRYYEAKRQLKLSKKRVKSVLSLSDQADEQQLEKILPSLSIASFKNENSPSASNLTKRSNDSFTKTHSQTFRRFSNPRSLGLNGSPRSLEQNTVLKSLERSVSFHTDDHKSLRTIQRPETIEKGKSKQLLGKLQFWKKAKQKNAEVGASDIYSTLSQTSSISVLNENESSMLEMKNPKVSSQTKLNNENRQAEEDVRFMTNSSEILNEETLNKQSSHPDQGLPTEALATSGLVSLTKRPRPESVISQFSQYSQTSHLYTMSESEADMMDGTDLEDDFYDDDGAYDSSINVSQQDLNQRPSSFSSSSRSQRRPPTFRIPSDTLVLSTSTSTTKRKNPLSQVSSNSSDDSNAILKIAERLEDGSNGSTSLTRPISPRYEAGRSLLSKPRATRTSSLPRLPSSNGQMVASPVPARGTDFITERSISPPFSSNPKNIQAGTKQRFAALVSDSGSLIDKSTILKLPTMDVHTWRRDSPMAVPASNVFELKFISINEEEEEEDEIKLE